MERRETDIKSLSDDPISLDKHVHSLPFDHTEPPTPANELTTDQLPSVPTAAAGKPARTYPLINEIACNTTILIAGWNDGSSGPLIPYIQKYYGISYSTVSILFLGSMVGCLAAGLSNGPLTHRFGMGRMLTGGTLAQLVGYALLVPAFRFPVMPVAFALLGFGVAFCDAQANTYVSTLPSSEHRLGILHCSYGTGALLAPLAATAFVTHGIQFSYFYGVSTGILFLNFFLILYVFRINYRAPESISSDPIELSTNGNAPEVELQPQGKKSLLAETMSNRSTLVFATFAFIYVGAEVSMGGWIVTFVLHERNGGSSAGYVATGFWAGIALGRIALPRLNILVGERRIVPYYLIVSCALEISIWFGRNLIGNGVAVALVGFLLAPLYPIMISLATKLLPYRLHATGIGFIGSFATVGGAIFPYLTGALAQKYSAYALQPIMLALFSSMIGVWMFVPPIPKRVE
ncbi:MFS general substrate transporter [Meredithblackwellia eburnea MCA 4105]